MESLQATLAQFSHHPTLPAEVERSHGYCGASRLHRPMPSVPRPNNWTGQYPSPRASLCSKCPSAQLMCPAWNGGMTQMSCHTRCHSNQLCLWARPSFPHQVQCQGFFSSHRAATESQLPRCFGEGWFKQPARSSGLLCSSKEQRAAQPAGEVSWHPRPLPAEGALMVTISKGQPRSRFHRCPLTAVLEMTTWFFCVNLFTSH